MGRQTTSSTTYQEVMIPSKYLCPFINFHDENTMGQSFLIEPSQLLINL